jgi:hypothetical protein
MSTTTTVEDEPHGELAEEAVPPPVSSFSGGPGAWLMATAAPAADALAGAGFLVTDDGDGAVVAVVSTRSPRHRIADLVAQAAARSLPVVVLTHPGGEAVAADAIRAGATTAIAEGDAGALARLATEPSPATDIPPTPEAAELSARLMEAYEARVVRGGTNRAAAAVTSPTSGLPSAAALTLRLATSDVFGSLRIVCFRVVHFDQAQQRMSVEASALLLRRLAVGFRSVCERYGELFDLGNGAYALLAPELDVEGAERIGRSLAAIAEAYTPDPTSPLLLAVGHAGPECSGDLATLRELATRAEGAAALEDTSTVLGAGELVGPMATASELEVMLRLTEMASRTPVGTDRMALAGIAYEIAGRLGFEGAERLLVRFVAHVADIGLVRVPGDENDPLYRNHPVEGAAFLFSTAGPHVAFGVRHTHEHWDGSGFPDGLAGSDIPIAARITAVAEALHTARLDPSAIADGAGTRFDPAVVDAAAELLREGVLP